MAKKPKEENAPPHRTGKARSRSKPAIPGKSAPVLVNALNVPKLDEYLAALNPDEVAELVFKTRSHLYWSLGDPTRETLRELRSSIPGIESLVDFEVIMHRLKSLAQFDRSAFGVTLSQFFPELVTVLNASDKRFRLLPRGTSKAESWLKPIARDSSADADLEAAIYFASRGQRDQIDVDEIADSWHAAICSDIANGRTVSSPPKAVKDRAKSQAISIAEAADILKCSSDLPRFFRFRDEEEDHIDQTMFRAVEWLGIVGFDAWLQSALSPLSVGPQDGIEHSRAGWWLFHWCRSSLAIEMADRHGLVAWLWALVNGPYNKEKPWHLYWEIESRFRDYLPLAGIILFVWRRIAPSQMSDTVYQAAIALLQQTQLRSGAWPLHTDDSEPSLLATCTAIHGLAVAKPPGWEKLTRRAAKWLAQQQSNWGPWHIEGGPTVHLTVLALDALELAHGGAHVTFRELSKSELIVNGPERSEPESDGLNEPTYDYRRAKWRAPLPPATTSQDYAKIRKAINPQLALVVATETELRQVLRVMTPLVRRPNILKVPHGVETYYLGKFGAFDAVLTLCTMGSQGPSGSTLSIDALIREWNPAVIVLLGIAFGTRRHKQGPADALVAEQLIPYEYQRVGERTIFRNPIPPSSPTLINRFRNAIDWTFNRPDNTRCQMHLGPVLSGDKLVDSRNFRNALLAQYPNAIGGEMEGAGLWSAAHRARKDWILVKAVCDWADGGKHKDFQEMAAASAVSLCLHVFSDPNTLAGV